MGRVSLEVSISLVVWVLAKKLTTQNVNKNLNDILLNLLNKQLQTS
jgi:hypothetical protein